MCDAVIQRCGRMPHSTLDLELLNDNIQGKERGDETLETFALVAYEPHTSPLLTFHWLLLRPLVIIAPHPLNVRETRNSLVSSDNGKPTFFFHENINSQISSCPDHTVISTES